MRVCCVTGATGFVGGHVARLVAERGDRARVTFRDQRRLERLHALDVDPVRADVLDRSSLRRAVRGVEVVVVNPSYVLGVPVDPYQAGETSTRVVGNFLLGKLPADVDGSTNVVDV